MTKNQRKTWIIGCSTLKSSFFKLRQSCEPRFYERNHTDQYFLKIGKSYVDFSILVFFLMSNFNSIVLKAQKELNELSTWLKRSISQFWCFFRNLMWNFAFWSFSTVRLPGFDNLCCLGLIVWGIRTWDENPVDGIAWKKESTMCFNCPDNDGKIIPPGCRWNNSIHQVSELKD